MIQVPANAPPEWASRFAAGLNAPLVSQQPRPTANLWRLDHLAISLLGGYLKIQPASYEQRPLLGEEGAPPRLRADVLLPPDLQAEVLAGV